MEVLSTTSSRRSLFQRWRDKLVRTPSPAPSFTGITCQRCAKINHIIESDLKWNTRLAKAPDVFSDSVQLHFDLKIPLWCPFCQLLLDAFQHAHGPCEKSELMVLAYFIDVAYKSCPMPGSWGIAVVRADLEPPNKKTHIKYSYAPLQREYRRQKGLVLPVAKGKTPDRQGRVACLIEESVNYKTFKQYIDKCSTDHSKCSVVSGNHIAPILVIDCSSHEIVQLPPTQEYCALSYVWGEQSSQIVIHGSLNSGQNWPRTILDAIHVTLSLGYQYLWVDRYCISDDNIENRRMYISMMDQIYELAEVTIVAAAGDDCHAGLPGAGTLPLLPRKRQRHALLNSTNYILAVPDVSSIPNTKWSTRGWTYQEAVLSRRCLVFTQEQIFFICRSDFFAESMPSTPQLTVHSNGNLTLQSLFSETNLSQKLVGRSTIPPGGWSPLDLLENHSMMYGARSLTHQEDALNAFRGILARSGYWNYWGIPCIPAHRADHPCKDAEPSDIPIPIFSNLTHLTLGILRGLAWCVPSPGLGKSQSRMRSTVPSWSWLARRDGRIRFLCHPEYKPPRRDSCLFALGDEIEVSINEQEAETEFTSGVVWTPLSIFWQTTDLKTKVISEQDFMLKLDAPVADVVQLLINIEHTPDKGDERSVIIGYHTKPMKLRRLIAMIDDEDDLPMLDEDTTQQIFTDLPWKLVKITSWTHCPYNESDTLMTSPIMAAYLIVAPKGDYWCRKGIAITPDHGTSEFVEQLIPTIAMTPNSTLPAQTTSRIASLNDEGFAVRSIILT